MRTWHHVGRAGAAHTEGRGQGHLLHPQVAFQFKLGIVTFILV